jgi:cobyric acid synthase
MTQVRKIVDSSSLTDIFDLPPDFMNRKVEVIMFPVEEMTNETPRLTRAQIEEAANAPEIQALVGVLEGAGLPADINMKDIRQMRLAEKYQI